MVLVGALTGDGTHNLVHRDNALPKLPGQDCFKMFLPRESEIQFCLFGDNPSNHKPWCVGLLSHINDLFAGMRPQLGVPVSSQTGQEK